MNPRARKLLRAGIAAGLYYSGILWLYAAVKLRHRTVVLMYHRVLPVDADTYSEEGIIVTPETFSRQLRTLKRFLRPVAVSQLAEALHTGHGPPSRGCVITFDDGWLDNIVHALPLLRQHRVPATVFLATNYIGGASCFWQERLARRMSVAIEHGGGARTLVEGCTVTGISTLPLVARRRAIRRAIEQMKMQPPADIARFERDLDRSLADAGARIESNGDDRFMDWPDVAALAASSALSAGAHGCSHVPLTSIAPAEAEAELLACRRAIEEVVGHPVTALAYPNGNYDDTVAALAQRLGYRVAFTTQRGLVSAGDDAFRLRRLNVHEASSRSMPEFLCLILGVFHKWPDRV